MAEFLAEDVTKSTASLGVMGPESRRVMQGVFPSSNFDNDAFPFGTFQELEFEDNGVKCVVRALRVSFVGELGWELHLPNNESAVKVYEKIFEQNTRGVSGVSVRDGGMWAILNSLRLEKGFVHNHHDLHPLVTPMECGLGFTVAWKKEGGFAGLSALRQQKKTPTKRLLSFVLEKENVALKGHYADAIRRTCPSTGVSAVVGQITSEGWSHVLDRSIGLGFVDLPTRMGQLRVRKLLPGQSLLRSAIQKRTPRTRWVRGFTTSAETSGVPTSRGRGGLGGFILFECSCVCGGWSGWSYLRGGSVWTRVRKRVWEGCCIVWGDA